MRLSRIMAFLVILLLLLCSPVAVLAASPQDSKGDAKSESAEILVKFKPGISASEMGQIHGLFGGIVKGTVPSIEVQVVSVPEGKASEKARAYASNPKVLYAEPDYLAEAIETPNDTYFGKQWGMTKVEAPQAWDVTKGDGDVRIAVLDTGVDSAHPDLASKLVASINLTSSPTADDVYGHGTHVAGIAAAETNNSVGVAGLGHSSSIVNVKVLGDDGRGYYSWIAQGIIWAADNGAQVINMSLGGTSASLALQDAVNYAWGKGLVVVAAAGNNGTSAPFYPAYYSNSIAVAATDSADGLASWSNRGDWVDVAAPGTSIYSTLKGGIYGYKSGTSMASPHTAGLAALLYAVVTDVNGNGRLNDEVRARMESTADPIASSGVGSGRINAFRAVDGIAAAPQPGAVSGRVTDSATGLGIENAAVSLGTISALTDSFGNYAITGLAPGEYIVSASKDGYQASSLSVTVVSAQTAIADLALKPVEPPASRPIWVESIGFSTKGKNMGIEVKVVREGGVVPGASVQMRLDCSGGQSRVLSGITDSLGVVKFTVSKPPSGTYTGTVTGLTATGYVWDTSQGITSASYVFGSSPTSGGKPNK